jgi:hypothetical protein
LHLTVLSSGHNYAHGAGWRKPEIRRAGLIGVKIVRGGEA